MLAAVDPMEEVHGSKTGMGGRTYNSVSDKGPMVLERAPCKSRGYN